MMPVDRNVNRFLVFVGLDIIITNGNISYMKIEKGQYAFWKHDTFPFVLGGVVSNVLPSGNVEIESYGSGTTGFKPVMVCDLERGELIHKRLTELTHRRRVQMEAVHRICVSQIYGISSELWKCIPRAD